MCHCTKSLIYILVFCKFLPFLKDTERKIFEDLLFFSHQCRLKLVAACDGGSCGILFNCLIIYKSRTFVTGLKMFLQQNFRINFCFPEKLKIALHGKNKKE